MEGKLRYGAERLQRRHGEWGGTAIRCAEGEGEGVTPAPPSAPQRPPTGAPTPTRAPSPHRGSAAEPASICRPTSGLGAHTPNHSAAMGTHLSHPHPPPNHRMAVRPQTRPVRGRGRWGGGGLCPGGGSANLTWNRGKELFCKASKFVSAAPTWEHSLSFRRSSLDIAGLWRNEIVLKVKLE